MKENANIKLTSSKVILIPYEKYHVPKYHSWMQSEELQHLTASEPLTLQQEYEMQESWRKDEDKCTFIILDTNIYNKTGNEIESMIGDTNIFFNQEFPNEGEIEIMIADKSSRGKGYGMESTVIMMIYGIEHLKIQQYQAKISLDNGISIKMFEKLGFQQFERSEVFKEVTLQKKVDEKWLSFLKKKYFFSVEKYDILIL